MKVLSVDGLSKLISLMKEDFALNSSLSTVAISGSYNDLSNKPTIPEGLPSQSGQSGKYLTTNGTTASWETVSSGSSYTAGTGIDISSNVISVTSPTLTNKQHNASGSSLVLGSTGSYSNDGGQAIGISHLGYSGWYSLGAGAISIGGLNASGGRAINIGGAQCSGDYSIQLGFGSNTESNSFYVGLSSSNNYKLLGSDGKIPDDRLNTTIARTSQIPSASDLLPSQSGNSGKFLTTNGTTVSWATVTQPSIATTSTAGLIKPDGTTITITNDGTISASSSSITFRTWSV